MKYACSATRNAVGTLALTLLLAACGQTTPQSTTAGVAATETGANVLERVDGSVAPLLGTDNPDAIPGQYIVVLSQGALGTAMSIQSAGSLISTLGLDPQGVGIGHVYAQALSGFAGTLSAQNLQRLRSDSRVKYIEQDGVMRASATQPGATWGLDRIDQRTLPLDGSYTYATTASDVRAYIIDTGINTAHTAFGGRAVWGTNTTGDGNDSDCQGHGTHVAGTVGSSTWGVAKGVSLVAVKVLDCAGSGSNSGVIAGVNWAVTNKGSSKAVANMSLGGSFSQAVNDAVNSAAAQNLVMVVAAGNENQNACNVSPASAASAITVGSTTTTDARSSFSNFGTCVDIFAPGSTITSTWIGSATATNTISGTSMASPHVAGAAALSLASGSAGTGAVTSALTGAATTGKVTGAGTGSPNLLLYTGTGSVTPPPSGGTTYTGSLSARGASSYQPSTTGFSYGGGTVKGALSGPSGTDFDLYLQKLSGTTWSTVASSLGSSSSETVNYAAASGTYRWRVYSYSGTGSFSLSETK